jgi:hypothetical protein
MFILDPISWIWIFSIPDPDSGSRGSKKNRIRSRNTAYLHWSAQYQNGSFLSPHRTLFHFISLHRPAAWAGSRAGPPVSVSLSL